MRKITNRKFSREYQDIERYEAGISLLGCEVKSIREGNIRLEEAFVKFIGGDLCLVNAEIPLYHFAPPQGYESRRSRRLLMHKSELLRIATKLRGSSGLTVVPVSCYNKGPHIKLEIALARGRRDVEKRKYDKEKDVERNEKREAKEWMRE